MFLNGIYVQQTDTGKWHVFQSPATYSPGGRQSATGYDTEDDALAAAKVKNFD